MTTTTTPAPPAIPPRVRTGVYLGALVVNVGTVLTLGLLVVWAVLDVERAAATAGVILGALGLLTSGLGVAYRPTRPGLLGGSDDG